MNNVIKILLFLASISRLLIKFSLIAQECKDQQALEVGHQIVTVYSLAMLHALRLILIKHFVLLILYQMNTWSIHHKRMSIDNISQDVPH